MPTFIANPGERYTRYHIDEIYKPGKPNSGPYVPNKGDHIVDPSARIEYVVVDVDYMTGVSVLEIWNARKITDPVGPTDHFVSNGVGTIQDTFRVLVDTSKTPYVANLDSRLTIKGESPSYVVFYKGEDVTIGQRVPVSVYFEDTNSQPTERVPLVINKEPAGLPVVKQVPKFYANQLLATNDIITMVIYNSDDVPLSEKRLSTYVTTNVRKSNSAARYINNLQIVSPLVNNNNPRLIEIPVNMDIGSANFMLRISYSDGGHTEIPVDGTRAKFVNLDSYISNRVGESANIVLVYIPEPGEYVATDIRAEDGSTTQLYRFLSVRGNTNSPELADSYSFKLHAFPRFSQSQRIWIMEYYLSSIDRDDIYYVTDMVDIISGSFDGAKLRLMQRLVVSIDVREVDSSFNQYIHIQEVVVTLMSPGTQDYAPIWYMRDTPSQSIPYGENILAVGTPDLGDVEDRWGLYIGLQANTLEEWLNKTYYASRPLFDPYADGAPLNPTHVRVVTGAGTVLQELSLTFNNISTPMEIDNFIYERGELIMLEFIRRSIGDQVVDKYLSTTGMSLVINQEQ